MISPGRPEITEVNFVSVYATEKTRKWRFRQASSILELMKAQAAQNKEQSNVKAPGQHMSERKELLLFLLIPSSVIALVAALLWFPSMLARPKYDFIYSSCPSYECDFDFTVKNGRISRAYDGGYLGDGYNYNRQIPRLYYYDVATGSTEQLDESKAQTYNLRGSNVSPDGYQLERANGEGSGGFLFWGGSGDYGWYLKDGLKKKRVNLSSSSSYYTENITLIGWVEE
mgnify:CR=1 FL=1